MSNDTINPYAAPQANLETPQSNGEITFTTAKKLKAGAGQGFISDAWRIYKKSPVKLTILSVLLVVMMIVFSLIPLIGSLFATLLYVPLVAGVFLGAEAIEKGEAFRFGHLFSGFKARGLRLVGFSLVYIFLYILSFAVPFLALGAAELMPLMLGEEVDPAVLAEQAPVLAIAMLSAVALNILVMMAYWFAIPLMVMQDNGIFQAMGKSFKSCLKNMLPLLVYGLMILIWMLLAVLPVGLGLFVLIPVLTLSMYTGYRQIFTE